MSLHYELIKVFNEQRDRNHPGFTFAYLMERTQATSKFQLSRHLGHFKRSGLMTVRYDTEGRTLYSVSQNSRPYLYAFVKKEEQLFLTSIVNVAATPFVETNIGKNIATYPEILKEYINHVATDQDSPELAAAVAQAKLLKVLQDLKQLEYLVNSLLTHKALWDNTALRDLLFTQPFLNDND